MKFILYLVLISINTSAAGFDCNKAQTKIEKAICKDRQLNLLDSNLNIEYKNAKQYMENEYFLDFKQKQIEWIKEVYTECNNAESLEKCLEKKYKDRISVINLEILHNVTVDKKVLIDAKNILSTEVFDTLKTYETTKIIKTLDSLMKTNIQCQKKAIKSDYRKIISSECNASNKISKRYIDTLNKFISNQINSDYIHYKKSNNYPTNINYTVLLSYPIITVVEESEPYSDFGDFITNYVLVGNSYEVVPSFSVDKSSIGDLKTTNKFGQFLYVDETKSDTNISNQLDEIYQVFFANEKFWIKTWGTSNWPAYISVPPENVVCEKKTDSLVDLVLQNKYCLLDREQSRQ